MRAELMTEYKKWLDTYVMPENHQAMIEFGEKVWSKDASEAIQIPAGVSYRHCADAADLISQYKEMMGVGGASLPGTATVPTGSALDIQVAGSHYKDKAIQPVEYIHANGMGFLEGCIIKRITRWRDKNGIEDLEKIKHEVDLLIELESRKTGQSS